MYGIRIKTPRGRGGLVQDIAFRNNRMTDVDAAMIPAQATMTTPSLISLRRREA
jgi:polygalacturonase